MKPIKSGKPKANNKMSAKIKESMRGGKSKSHAIGAALSKMGSTR